MGRLRLLDEEMEKEVIEMYQCGICGSEIAERKGISAKTIYRIFKRNNISMKRGRRADKIYTNTSSIKHWLLTHPGEVLDSDVEELAARFNKTKRYIWNYLYKIEKRLETKVRTDAEWFMQLLNRPGAGVVYRSSIIPVVSMTSWKFIRKKYTRTFRIKIVMGEDTVLLSDYFDYLTYHGVIKE